MSKTSNQRRSQWRVVNRCLGLLLRLMRGPARNDDLLEIIYDDALLDDKELTHSSAHKRFEEDRNRLKTWFGIELNYDRSTNEYTLGYIGRPLLDLPEEAIAGAAFLASTFGDDSAPMATEIRRFLDTVMALLPVERRRDIQRRRGLLEVELRVRDEDEIAPDIWYAVQVSVAERRQLEFDYMAGSNQDGIVRQHLIEPIRYFFDATRKHYYLEGFWLESRSHKGVNDQRRVVQPFRMGRISNPQVLPSHFSPGRRIPKKELVYLLTPEVARHGVTRHFEDMHVIHDDDGTARVHVMSRNLFFDLRTLLHYGPNCRVIGGNEAVREMKLIVKRMAENYVEPDNAKP